MPPFPQPASAMSWRLAAFVVACMAVTGAASAADSRAVSTIIDDVPGAGRLAAPVNGQTLYVLDNDRSAVVAVDPFEPAKRATVIDSAAFATAAGAAAARPVAIGCIDSNTLAVVCRAGESWSVRTFNRLPSPRAVGAGMGTESASALQTLPLGASRAVTPGALGDDAAVDLVVSPSRDWLTVIGLPPPLPPAMRAPIAGARSEPFSERRCPRLPAGQRPVAATVSLADEWVLFVPESAGDSRRIFLSFYANTGSQRLLHLDSGLADIRDAACCRGSGTLWVVGGGAADGPTGLWRIDAAIERGRQTARPVCIARLDDPLAVACLSDRAIAVTVGGPARRVVLVNPQVAPATNATTP
jgi:hypothetical protein